LPASQTNSEKCIYISTSFCNLKTAVEPIREDFAKHLLMSLIEDLNRLFPMDLATDFVSDRYTDSEVFDEKNMDRTAPVLIGAS
jgi:hypothetical protein